MLWDTYIDDIFKLEQTIGNLQIRMTAAGILEEINFLSYHKQIYFCRH